ncbi:DUF262 domain-containing protein [Rhodococcus jostii]|nr:DUF262 domain-containing protein [Rhodococcus jostii]
MSRPADLTSQQEVEEWFEIEEEAEELPSAVSRDPAEKYAASQLRVVRETKDYQLDYLRVALQPGQGMIDTSPKYQRRLRWNNKKKSLLIESFLLNIPVPPIYLFEHDYNAYEVIDGRQRLEALRTFLSNEMALTGLEYWPELNGKRFTTLPNVLQKGLVRRSLPAVVLLAETSKPTADEIDVRQVLFDRLNTGGVKLNPQELRNALYNGPLNSLLIRLARTEAFTQAWGIPGPTANEESDPPEDLLRNPLYSTLADAELVLRFFALRDAIMNGHKGSLRRILDQYMSNNSQISSDGSDDLSLLFTSTLERLSTIFEGRPFILSTGKRSRPLYDALMVALSLHPDIDVEADSQGVRQRLADSLRDERSYDILVGRGNTIQAVRDRVALATQILGGSI